MSQQQQPLPEQLVLLSFTEQQKVIILTQLQAVVQGLLELRFVDPSKDHELIRHHAALTGQKVAYENLLKFDAEQTQQFETSLNPDSQEN
jgi:hypothetical protein